MGAGHSCAALPRLRKFLVIKAYNSRARNTTLREQFTPLRVDRVGGRAVIQVSAVKEVLSIKAQWVDDVIAEVLHDVETVDFEAFMQFLENGNIMAPPPAPVGMTPVGSQAGIANGMGPVNRSRDKKRRLLRFATTQDPNATIYPEVMAALEYKFEPVSAVVVHKGVALNRPKFRPVPLHPGKPLWRKREVIRQERIVQYTTVDSKGVVQELLETERTQTEVLHMECRETGEFAHRESTEYEQLETFNNEVVTHEQGNEEYVHLKSLEDEYEYLDSNMPNRRAPVSPQDSPPSPINDGPETDVPDGYPPEYLFEAAAGGGEERPHHKHQHDGLVGGIPPEYLYAGGYGDDVDGDDGDYDNADEAADDIDFGQDRTKFDGVSGVQFYADGVLADELAS